MGAALALLSSLLWGTGDFLGGTLSRRAHPVAVIRISQGLAAAALVVIVVLTGEAGRTGAIPWGIAAAVLGSLGLGSFYAALAAGTMGVVAPVAATGVVIPVVVGLVQGDSPSPLQMGGIVVAIVGVVLASGPERRATLAEDVAEAATEADAAAVPTTASRRPLVLAGIAALGFGSALSLVAEGSESSVAMTLLVMRVATTVGCTLLLLTVLRAAPRPRRRDLPVLAAISATDAGANGTFAIASTLGQVSVSAVLASLYPAVTALLAWRIHHESLRRIQVVGVVATLGGVALIAGG
ncbi:EamA family transporter [Iamia majanohamensis]|uniref:EamA family transporter n=1 Tax=Iamia majanohamensis TaxID=467976 RepID=A0AAE9YDR5_9ACTN|nr:EamA family transporter [Iamia majanohamensis]WCO65966.1 EamA family transporter [Iamia majanohamensis]